MTSQSSLNWLQPAKKVGVTWSRASFAAVMLLAWQLPGASFFQRIDDLHAQPLQASKASKAAAQAGNRIWVYSPPIGNGSSGRMIQIAPDGREFAANRQGVGGPRAEKADGRALDCRQATSLSDLARKIAYCGEGMTLQMIKSLYSNSEYLKESSYSYKCSANSAALHVYFLIEKDKCNDNIVSQLDIQNDKPTRCDLKFDEIQHFPGNVKIPWKQVSVDSRKSSDIFSGNPDLYANIGGGLYAVAHFTGPDNCLQFIQLFDVRG
jgi:hypothetical protein